MKIAKLTILFILVFTSVYAQKHTVEITNVKTEKALIIKAKNTNNTQFEVTLTVQQQNLKGYKNPITKLIPANSEIEIVKLYYIKGKKWSYSTSYKYKSKPNEQELGLKQKRLQEKSFEAVGDLTKGIVVFSKDGCTRCHYVTSYMLDNNIDFKFLNTTDNKIYNKLMWQLLKEKDPNETTLKSITMPVVLVDGKISYNMKDLKEFVSKFKK